MQLYKSRISEEIKKDFRIQGDLDLESFLKNNFEVYKEKHKVTEGLLWVNFARICIDYGITPNYFYAQVDEILDDTDDWY